jgi:hypothetical protein
MAINAAIEAMRVAHATELDRIAGNSMHLQRFAPKLRATSTSVGFSPT